MPCRTLTHDSSQRVGCTTPPLYDATATNGALAVAAHVAAPPVPPPPRHPSEPPLPPPPPLLLASTEARFSLRAPPRVSTVTPSNGPLAGGTRLTISGSFLGQQPSDVLNVTLGEAACDSSWKVPSDLFEDSAPSARLVPPGARAAPTQSAALPEQLESLVWHQQPALGRPKVGDSPLSTSRCEAVHHLSPHMLQCSAPPAAAMGAVAVAVATASAGRSASHATLAAGSSPAVHPYFGAGATALPLFRYAPLRRLSLIHI